MSWLEKDSIFCLFIHISTLTQSLLHSAQSMWVLCAPVQTPGRFLHSLLTSALMLKWPVNLLHIKHNNSKLRPHCRAFQQSDALLAKYRGVKHWRLRKETADHVSLLEVITWFSMKDCSSDHHSLVAQEFKSYWWLYVKYFLWFMCSILLWVLRKGKSMAICTLNAQRQD